MAGFSNTALLRLELHSGSSGQMRRASSGHWRSAALWVKDIVGRPSVSINDGNESAPSPIFLFLRWFESSSRIALGIHVEQNLKAKTLNVKLWVRAQNYDSRLEYSLYSHMTMCSFRYSVCTCTRRAQCFGLKECQFAFTERRTIIYENSTV